LVADEASGCQSGRIRRVLLLAMKHPGKSQVNDDRSDSK
jgi:hypothetical protein